MIHPRTAFKLRTPSVMNTFSSGISVPLVITLVAEDRVQGASPTVCRRAFRRDPSRRDYVFRSPPHAEKIPQAPSWIPLLIGTMVTAQWCWAWLQQGKLAPLLVRMVADPRRYPPRMSGSRVRSLACRGAAFPANSILRSSRAALSLEYIVTRRKRWRTRVTSFGRPSPESLPPPGGPPPCRKSSCPSLANSAPGPWRCWPTNAQ